MKSRGREKWERRAMRDRGRKGRKGQRGVGRKKEGFRVGGWKQDWKGGKRGEKNV